jgi:dipeptidyl aminopeptidase/acylaminoacyl peptidase
VAELSTPDHETSMEVSPDGLTLYVSSDRDGAGVDVYQSTRLSRAAPWTTPVLVTELSSSDSDYDATPTADPLVLYLASNRPPAGFDESDIWRFTRADAGAAWAVDELVVGASSASYETDPFLDASGTLWFTADIAGVDFDLYRALPNGDGSFGAAARVGELATAATESDAWLSPDGRTIYFTSSRDGTYDIFVARR